MAGLSIRAYAEHRRQLGLAGGNPSAVQKAIKSGRIAAARDPKTKRIDPEKADALWGTNTEPRVHLDQVAAPAPPAPSKRRKKQQAPEVEPPATAGGIGYQDAKALHEAIKAKHANLKYQEAAKRLVRADDVRKEAFEQARQVRDSLDSIPERLAAPLAAESDPRQVATMLREAIRGALASLEGGA